MNEYRYRAVDPSGAVVQGDVQAADRTALASMLAQHGETLLEARPMRWGRGKRLQPEARLLWYQQVAVLLRAGMPLHEALDHIATVPGAAGQCSRGLAHALTLGQTLSDAMGKRPRDFGALARALVRSGEATGDLATSLETLREMEAWWLLLHKRLRSAMAYPAMTLALLSLVVPLLLVVLVPQLTGLVSLIGGELPWYTQLLLSLSAMAVSHGWLAVCLVTATVFGMAWLCSAGRPLDRWWAHTVLRLPLIGPLRLNAELALACRQIAELYGAGLPLDNVLVLSADSLSNRILKSTLQRAAVAVSSGKTFHQAVANDLVLPPLFHQLVHTGELSGRLDKTLLHAGTVFGQEADRAAQKLAATVGPVLLLTVALIVAWLVVALFLPLYDSLFLLGDAW